MFCKLKWKWHLRVLLDRIGIWSLLSTLRLGYAYATRRPHDPDFRFLANFQGREGLLIDVGANAGQSVVSCRIFNRSFSILSFEPNPFHQKDLKRVKVLFGLGKFNYHLVGLAEESGALSLFIPVVNSVLLSQEATLSKDNLTQDQVTRKRIYDLSGSSEFSVKEIKIVLKKLDDYELKPDFVKLDVQLSELRVIKGMEKTLRNSYPILMIENGPDLMLLAQYLEAFDYEPYQYDSQKNKLEPSGIKATCMNLFFVPKARLSHLTQFIIE